NARLGIAPMPRTLILSSLFGTAGFFSGFSQGARYAGHRYLAENYHRLPADKQGWYFYHKTRNYVVLRDGLSRGMRTAAAVSAFTIVFCSIEAGIDRVLGNPSWTATTAAAVSTAIPYLVMKGQRSVQLAKSSIQVTVFAAAFGLLQDYTRNIRK
ncbi:hypothetical protein CANCADRAFT_12039, partial [Tortispora caseinolytica NRRL Y-17796]